MQQPTKSTMIEHIQYESYWKWKGERTSETKTEATTFKAVLACSLLDAWKESKNNTLVIESFSSSVRAMPYRVNEKLYPIHTENCDVNNNVYQFQAGDVNDEQRIRFYSANINFLISAGIRQYYGVNDTIHRTMQLDEKKRIPYHKVECKFDELQKAMAAYVPLCTTLLHEVFAKAKLSEECGILSQVPTNKYPDVLFALFAAGVIPNRQSKLYDAKIGESYYIVLSPENMKQFKQYCEAQCKTEFKIGLENV